jgi:hypothetical protein
MAPDLFARATGKSDTGQAVGVFLPGETSGEDLPHDIININRGTVAVVVGDNLPRSEREIIADAGVGDAVVVCGETAGIGQGIEVRHLVHIADDFAVGMVLLHHQEDVAYGRTGAAEKWSNKERQSEGEPKTGEKRAAHDEARSAVRKQVSCLLP